MCDGYPTEGDGKRKQLSLHPEKISFLWQRATKLWRSSSDAARRAMKSCTALWSRSRRPHCALPFRTLSAAREIRGERLAGGSWPGLLDKCQVLPDNGISAHLMLKRLKSDGGALPIQHKRAQHAVRPNKSELRVPVFA